MKKNAIALLLLTIIDVLLWFIFFNTPEPVFREGITTLFTLLLISVINLIIGFILLFAESSFAGSFFINAVLSFFLLRALITWDTHRKSDLLYERWEFSIGNENYRVTRYIYNFKDTTVNGYNPPDSFDVATFGDGRESGVRNGRGTVLEKKDTLFFYRTDSTLFYITSGHLYNFEGKDYIPVKKQ